MPHAWTAGIHINIDELIVSSLGSVFTIYSSLLLSAEADHFNLVSHILDLLELLQDCERSFDASVTLIVLFMIMSCLSGTNYAVPIYYH